MGENVFEWCNDSYFKLCVLIKGNNFKCGKIGNEVLLVELILYFFVFGKGCVY